MNMVDTFDDQMEVYFIGSEDLKIASKKLEIECDFKDYSSYEAMPRKMEPKPIMLNV